MTDVGVEIAWDDGRTCTYPYRYLRLQCACAACVEEMTGRALLNVSAVPEDIIAVEYIEVGKYADLIVLDQNLIDIDSKSISDTRVLLTLLEGNAVYGNPENL